MRALIADDEAPARAKLRRLLEASNDIEIVGEASTGREAVAPQAHFDRAEPTAYLNWREGGSADLT